MTARWIGRLALTASCLLVALAFPATAPAKRGLTTGFAGVDPYQSTDSSQRALWFDRTVDSGAGLVRLSLGWANVAPQRPLDPTNPGSTSYDFSTVDPAVRDASSRGLKVMVTINIAPTWAEGPGRPASAHEGTWRPNASDFADFIQAVAARYSGGFDPDGIGPEPPLPAVDALEIWNEPNSSDWLTPQFQGKTAVAPELYRDLLNASYKAVKRVNPNMQVVAAGTDPYGDPPGGPYPPGVQRVQPVQFWQQLLCVRPAKVKKKKGKKKSTSGKFVRTNCPAKPMFDIFAHHPIDNTGGGPLRSGPRPGDASTPDLGRVVRVLRAAERLGTVSPGGKHPVWVTEFWWDSKPPNPVGAPPVTQARWIEQSLYLFWKAGASAAINFEIKDQPSRPGVHAGLQSGVYFADDRPKPSLTAFQFPFVTERINQRKLRAWGKAPEGGTLLIQRQQGARWVTVKKLQVSKGAVFDTTLSLQGKQRLRATVGNSKSLVWKQAGFGSGKRASGGGGPSAPMIILSLIAALVLVVGGTAILRRRQLQRHRRPRTATG